MSDFPLRLQEGYRAFVEGRLPRERERFEDLAATGQKPELLGLLGGKRAAQGEMAFSLRSKDGQIFLGPLMLGKIPPLY